MKMLSVQFIIIYGDVVVNCPDFIIEFIAAVNYARTMRLTEAYPEAWSRSGVGHCSAAGT